jgi:hypothetical protein
MDSKVNKGLKSEEVLRNYFLKAGYYVVRAVPFKYEEFEITDIDLWLYGRTSSVSREIIIVDIKNKKTPQAIERIFWVNGLKNAVSANKAIVVTTDRRKAVREFGKKLGVTVLDGFFLSRLMKSEKIKTDRLSDEEFYSKIDSYTLGKIDGDWKGKIKMAKSYLASNISFDTCNSWIENTRFFAEQIITKPRQKEVASRCMYLLLSFIVLAIDLFQKEISFLNDDEQKVALTQGFTHGDRGKLGTKRLLEFSLSLIDQYSIGGHSIVNEVRKNIEDQMAKLPSHILSEYFSKKDVAKSLFSMAKELEELSSLREVKYYNNASLETRSLVNVFLDFWGIDRKVFSDTINGT